MGYYFDTYNVLHRTYSLRWETTTASRSFMKCLNPGVTTTDTELKLKIILNLTSALSDEQGGLRRFTAGGHVIFQADTMCNELIFST